MRYGLASFAQLALLAAAASVQASAAGSASAASSAPSIRQRARSGAERPTREAVAAAGRGPGTEEGLRTMIRWVIAHARGADFAVTQAPLEQVLASGGFTMPPSAEQHLLVAMCVSVAYQNKAFGRHTNLRCRLRP